MSLYSPEYWMQKAIVLAKSAALNNEVPVGAVVVLDNEIIGQGSNGVIHRHDPTAHAEIQALQQAALKIGNYRLVNADLYVTLEPCAMCAGALVHSRIRHLYFGALEAKSGAVVSNINLLGHACMNHRVAVTGEILSECCSAVISDFFTRRRAEKKALKNSSQ
jgi:tRNA(adenine34) deaminase